LLIVVSLIGTSSYWVTVSMGILDAQLLFHCSFRDRWSWLYVPMAKKPKSWGVPVVP